MTDERLEKLKNWVDLMLMMASDTINDGEIKTSLVRAKDDVMSLITAEQQRLEQDAEAKGIDEFIKSMMSHHPVTYRDISVPEMYKFYQENQHRAVTEEVQRAINMLQTEMETAVAWRNNYKDNEYAQDVVGLYDIKISNFDLAVTALRQMEEHEQWKIEIEKTRESQTNWAEDRFDLQQEINALRQMQGSEVKDEPCEYCEDSIHELRDKYSAVRYCFHCGREPGKDVKS